MMQSQHLSTEQLRRFFRPRSIALVGATDNSRWSIYTYENLKNYSFPGPIYLVHPTREIVHGQQAYKSLHALPEPVDLVFVMVSTPRVFSIVQEAAELGMKNFVILTSGFSEMGDEGARLECELLSFAQDHDLTLLGPNGNGFIHVTDQITPYGLPITPPLTDHRGTRRVYRSAARTQDGRGKALGGCVRSHFGPGGAGRPGTTRVRAGMGRRRSVTC